MEPTPSFSAVYRAYGGLVAATLRRHGVATASLEDATQDVFVAAYRRRDDFDGRAPRAWLRAIARRVAFNYRRQATRAARKHDALEFGTRHAPAGGDVHADLRAIDRFVQSLSPDDRRLFVLSELEGRTSRELAAPLSTNPNTLYSRIRVLRQRLRSGVRSVVVFVMPVVKPLAPAVVVAALVVGATQFRGSADTSTLPAPPRLAHATADSDKMAAAGATPGSTLGSTHPVAPSEPPPESGLDPSAPPPVVVPSVVLPTLPTEALARRRALSSAPSPDATSSDATSPDATSSDTTSSDATSSDATSSDTLREQSQRLLRADAVLRDGKAVEALAILARHRHDFPNSPLADLRAAIGIDALRRSGEPTQACAEARAFLGRYPQASTTPRVKNSCPELHDQAPERK